jgi:hypothetical protein
MKYVEKLVTENPNKVKELIEKFVSKPKGSKNELSDFVSMSV